jgi:nitroreductase
MSFRDLIAGRTSVRTFSERPLPRDLQQTIEGIQQSCLQEDVGSFSQPQKLHLLSKGQITANRLGSYGVIRHPQAYLTGVCENERLSVLRFGYMMEKILLHLRSMGIEACWLGGMFNRGAFTKLLRAEEKLIIPAVLPLGYPAEKQAIADRIIRTAAGSHKRLDMEMILLDAPHSVDEHLDAALQALRLAPSASNKQPWRVNIEPNAENIHLFLNESRGYNSRLGYPVQMLDMGIGMAHIYLVLSEYDENPLWHVDPGHADEPGYIATLIRR